jgi:hypothetical protein
MSALHLLAENNFGDTRSGGLAGPMGLLIIVLMAIATVLLIRNMTARIKRLPAEFPDNEATGSGDHKADRRADTAGEQAESGSADGESSPTR